jgi:hypothetical protein
MTALQLSFGYYFSRTGFFFQPFKAGQTPRSKLVSAGQVGRAATSPTQFEPNACAHPAALPAEPPEAFAPR